METRDKGELRQLEPVAGIRSFRAGTGAKDRAQGNTAHTSATKMITRMELCAEIFVARLGLNSSPKRDQGAISREADELNAPFRVSWSLLP
jgi:hypothetical protein